jgi:hypothetical protein
MPMSNELGLSSSVRIRRSLQTPRNLPLSVTRSVVQALTPTVRCAGARHGLINGNNFDE